MTTYLARISGAEAGLLLFVIFQMASPEGDNLSLFYNIPYWGILMVSMMDVYKTKCFQRLLKKSTLTDADLMQSCSEMNNGLIDADYGGLLFKKRVAKVNQGKSGGYRTMVGARLGNRFVFVYMFEKNSRDNIAEQEVKALKKLVRLYLDADYDWLEQQILNGLLFKVNHEE